jgi:hypothetical protein
MAEPYVQFFVDAATGAPIRNSAKYTAQPRLQPAQLFLTVACDSTGTLVVRRLAGNDVVVCATAIWQGGHLHQHAQDVPNIPWAEIETALREELYTAQHLPEVDRTARDSGVLGAVTPGPATPAAPRPPMVKRIATAIGMVIVVGLLIVGVTLYNRFRAKYDKGRERLGVPARYPVRVGAVQAE